MEEKLMKYYAWECNEAYAILSINPRPYWVTPKEIIDNAKQRCLGASLFLQNQNLAIGENVSELYAEVERNLSAILEDFS